MLKRMASACSQHRHHRYGNSIGKILSRRICQAGKVLGVLA
jgi:hypothetical protein